MLRKNEIEIGRKQIVTDEELRYREGEIVTPVGFYEREVDKSTV